MRILTFALAAFLFTACSKSSNTPAAESPTPAADPAAPADPAGRPSITSTDCAAQGGEVVGDIGDGAIHRPDYVCASGAAPIASISNTAGEAVAIEGSVCCKKAQ